MINQDYIRKWLEVFKNQYLNKIGVYLRYQYAKADYLKQMTKRYDDVKFVGINMRGQEEDNDSKI
ncbi:signal transduction protein [Rippkaea orientalis PCC 8801]|uniref:Signal transduction protein n=2 Tax=Rippkaea TaxID=2546365 RepID=B7K4X5_RIPO1|nr:signal transduction protein [Rippkaea orientalis PCC 8801]